jgi:uncharacterized protein (TIGR00369 family)
MQFQDLDRKDVGFLEYIGGELLELSDGSARLAFEIRPHHTQHLGIVHGGAIATLADHCGWYAVISQLDKGFTSVTIELKINYLKPATGATLIANARVVNRTKRTAFATIEIVSEEVLVAFATATYSIINETKRTIRGDQPC